MSWRKVEEAERIIPALAGNTGTPLPLALCNGDHPRSRGEYPRYNHENVTEHGSSPLSRGIQPRALLRQRPGRIIPALAGNTIPSHSTRAMYQDHPRSRGEYAGFRCLIGLGVGSSPLSRGILICNEPFCFVLRIIPALAGNTDLITAYMMTGRDHPRSRGEYLARCCGGSIIQGSSPLSRGIPVR